MMFECKSPESDPPLQKQKSRLHDTVGF